MSSQSNQFNVSLWTINDLELIPRAETDLYEYKSSKSIHKLSELRKKIKKAASGFWNSGGGYFVIGVDDNGKIDGGIPKYIGKQPILEWVQQSITEVNFEALFTTNQIEIVSDKCVVIIGFSPTTNVPIMNSEDNKYYIRAGARTEPANQFIVESLFSKRNLQSPVLRGVIHENATNNNAIDLKIIAINSSVALDIEIDFSPRMEVIEDCYGDLLPFTVSAIDKSNPFSMAFASSNTNNWEQWGIPKQFDLILKYNDIYGNHYFEQQTIHLDRSFARIEYTSTDDLKNHIKKISRSLESLKNQYSQNSRISSSQSGQKTINRWNI